MVLLGLLCVLAMPVSALAAGHYEVTVISLGPGFVPKGESDESFRLASSAEGKPLPQALVLMAARPFMVVPRPVPLDSDTPYGHDEEYKEQFPATVTLTVAGKQLPPWELFDFPTAYIINLETLRANPEYAKGRAAIKFAVETVADGVSLRAFGMPDPLLLNESLNGPLARFHEQSPDEEMRAYFEGLAHEVAGHYDMAGAAYRGLIASKNEQLARLARRGMRMCSYDERPHKLSGNFREHFRWGLYLQQCGFFVSAYKHFNEARIIYDRHPDALYRTGEMLDQIAGDVFTVMDFMNRSGEAAWELTPSRWSCLLVIQRGTGPQRLSSEEMLNLKANWLIARSMIWAATSGKVLPVAVMLEDGVSRPAGTPAATGDEFDWPLIDYGDGIIAPSRDIVAERGWFDSVFYLRPRPEAEHGTAESSRTGIRTVGGDEGPNGAALSVLPHTASWSDFMTAWYEHFTWAADVGEIDEAIPLAGEVGDSGYPPVPGLGYAARSALRYHYSSAMLRRVQMTPRPGVKEFVRIWRLEGPFAASSIRPSESDANGRLLAPLPEPRSDEMMAHVSRRDFIDLARLFPDAGPALVRATCWVFSPEDQEVRMWIGRNDGAAVWINGRLVHSGRHYASGQYRDRNLVDTVASYAPLRAGWNEVRVVVESLPAPDDGGWGFSLRFCNLRNEPVPGLAYVNRPPGEGLVPPYAPPPAGPHYAWESVRRNWSELLPRLSEDGLRRLTGVNDLRLSGTAGPGGHVLLAAGARGQRGRYREMSHAWKAGEDRDVELNNVLDWDREACVAIRYERDGAPRDLLLVKPEALMAHLKLLKEPRAAAGMFDGKTPDERLLGYVVVPTAASARRLFAIDCLLGDTGEWPLDEEDLLEPIAAEFIPNPPQMFPIYQPMLPES